jgi:ABC-type transport system substrate-binding protein
MIETTYWTKRRIGRRSVLRGAGVGAAGLAGAALVGCGDDDDGGAEGTAGDPTAAATNTVVASATADSSGAQRGGELKVVFAADPTGLDPSTSRGGGDHNWLYSMFENLVNNGPNFTVEPGISDSWEVVDDLTIRFHTRTGFKYQDGSDFSTEDIRYTIERHQDPETQSYAAGQVQSISEVEVIDDENVVLHLNTITSPLFAILGDRAGMIMPRDATAAAGADFTNNPVGSGPFKLTDWRVDASLRLERFGDYWQEGYPYLDSIQFEIVPNASVQFANLRTGAADYIDVDPKDRAEARNSSDIQYQEWTSTGYTQINTNVAIWPNDDVRLRQAMTYSLNRPAVLEGIFFGEGELANGPLTGATWAFNSDLAPIEEDLDRSKQLLDAAGYPDGIEFEMVIVANDTNTPFAEMIKAQWARVGIDVTLVARSAEEAGAEYRNQQYPIYLVGFSGRADPDMTIYENFHSQGAFNRVIYNDEYAPDDLQLALDAKIEQGRSLYDQEERKPIYDDIQRQIVEEAHGIFFTHSMNAVGISQRVSGFTPYGDGKDRLHQLWLTA